jgi:hypothetical protein
MTRPEVAETVIVGIRQTLRRLTTATIILYVVAIGIALGAGFTANMNREAACSLRTDVERRVANGKQFLDKHPEGLPKIGFTRSDILKEIQNQERTVDSLGVLICFD